MTADRRPPFSAPVSSFDALTAVGNRLCSPGCAGGSGILGSARVVPVMTMRSKQESTPTSSAA
jgi:hypothetical protein